MNTLDVKKKFEIYSFRQLIETAQYQFLLFEKVEGHIKKATKKAWGEYDFSIDCPQDQMLFKDMLQIRFIEELTEASIALTEETKDHFHEEIVDALNFFLAAYTMVGVDVFKYQDPEVLLNRGHSNGALTQVNLQALLYQVVESTGFLCNLLKNRPWSQSNYLVSMLDFNERLENLWIVFWSTLGCLGFTKEIIFDIFAKKFSVNLFRIESHY